MRIVDPSIEVTFHVPENGQTPEQAIEVAGRNCYKSEEKITEDSADKFVRMLRKRGHTAMLEFGYATAHIIGDRGVSHELVRHRLASFAQESTRYCNYSKGKFSGEITVVRQQGFDDLAQDLWVKAMGQCESNYMQALEMGVAAQHARSLLPISLKAEIVIGANLREWRHIFKLRCAKAAHPMIKGLMRDALRQFGDCMPALYEDLVEEFLPTKGAS